MSSGDAETTLRTVEEIRMRDLARNMGGQYAWAMKEIDRLRAETAEQRDYIRTLQMALGIKIDG